MRKRVSGVVRAILPFTPADSWYMTPGPSPAYPIPVPSAVIDDDEGGKHMLLCGDDLAEGDVVDVIYERVSIRLFGFELLAWWGMVGFEKAA